MSDENTKPWESYQAKAKETLAKQQQERAAMATPMPGPLADAFAPPKNIQVGPFTVRPFYDLDMEVLQDLKHPILDLITNADKFKGTPAEMRGPNGWHLCWVLTHSLDEVEAAWLDGSLRDKARREFGRQQIGTLVLLTRAIYEQFQLSFVTLVQLDAAGGDEPSQKKSE